MDPHHDALLSQNDRKSRLSVAYVQAIAASAGYVATEPAVDTDSIDLKIDAGGAMRPKLEVQLKATGPLAWSSGEASFRLKRKNYDDLREARSVPAILVVLEMPADERDWAAFEIEGLVLRRCAWWLSLLGAPEEEQQTHTVRLRENQRFEPGSLRELMERTRKGRT